MGDSLKENEGNFESDWRMLWVGGMWFQDLWTADFRRTEMCGIPYGTQEGEISFCAYNTGIGWRQIIENKYMTAKTTEWFKSNGRHKIYSGDSRIPLPALEHDIQLPVLNGGNGKDNGKQFNKHGDNGRDKGAAKDKGDIKTNKSKRVLKRSVAD
jgi:hypothetical protein